MVMKGILKKSMKRWQAQKGGSCQKKHTKAKAKASSSKGPPLTKGSKPKAKAKSKLAKSLTRANLSKVPKMSLAEKVQMAEAENDTVETAALQLKGTLSKDESAKMWSKHQTHLKGNPAEAEEHSSLGKKEKGLAVVVWYLKNCQKKWFHTQTQKETAETLTKGEKWLSELQILQQFSEYELNCHLESGRVSWRHDPMTAGIYQYRDNADITREVSVKRAHKATVGQEREALEEDEDIQKWTEDFQLTGGLAMQRAESAFGGKGKGKGSPALTKGKGKGQGKGRGQKGQLAIEDGSVEEGGEGADKTPEQQWALCLTKAKKAKEQLLVALSNFEDALELASKAGRATKEDKKMAQGTVSATHTMERKLKAILAKRVGGNVEDGKKTLVAAAQALKKLKDETKDLKALANKALSKASTSKRSK